MRDFLVIKEQDNVMIVLHDTIAGTVLGGIKLLNDVPSGHKVALCDIKKGQNIVKYGSPIGHASCDILRGQHVHTHNVATNLKDTLNYVYNKAQSAKLPTVEPRNVQVYERANGQVGIRNEIFIVPTVGCVNAQAAQIASGFKALHTQLEVDDVVAFAHPYGCSQLGDDHQNTKRILQSIVLHPNAGAVLVLGLGCENNQIRDFVQGLGQFDEQRIRFLVAQDVQDEVACGIEIVEQLYELARHDVRVTKPLSVLNIGLKCGGSDGFSGITANPLLGYLSDYLVASGATSVLTEVPEMFGAEHLLMERAQDSQVFDKIVRLINDFKHYYTKNGQNVYENPSPGNKAGGITTLEDKSLGCVQKAGSSQVVDVLFDGDRLQKRGLNLLNGPGNDMIAVTNLGSVGCHMVLFTTGRGTPFGGFVPTVKVATNSALAKNKSNWIDFDAGSVLVSDFEQGLLQLVDYVCKVASGQKTQNEKHNCKEISIFKSGVIL